MRNSDFVSSSLVINERKKLQLFSPAKLNLFFRVLCKRQDGFHEIASLYQAISLGDSITISYAQEDLLTCSDPNVACNETNLVSKALHVFRVQTGRDFKVHIHIDKRIPMQAGLGGGSSNAATALWGLNALSENMVSDEVLANWAATFSSDAPFFFSEGTAYCRGRGEVIQNLKALPQRNLWIAKPKLGLSTPLVYQHCQPSTFEKRDPDLILEQLLHNQRYPESGTTDPDPMFFNDLEIPAFSILPELAALKQQLQSLGFSHVTMTGSGTAFFCIGNVNNPMLSGIDFFPVSFHSRSSRNWYEFPHLCYDTK